MLQRTEPQRRQRAGSEGLAEQGAKTGRRESAGQQKTQPGWRGANTRLQRREHQAMTQVGEHQAEQHWHDDTEQRCRVKLHGPWCPIMSTKKRNGLVSRSRDVAIGGGRFGGPGRNRVTASTSARCRASSSTAGLDAEVQPATWQRCPSCVSRTV